MIWQKFATPSYAVDLDEEIRNCTRGVNLNLISQERRLCRDVLRCVLGASSALEQAQFSSAATVLGLLPTALSMMATSTDDLLRIHARFPILAFLMSLCNPSTISSSISSSPVIVRPSQRTRSPKLLIRLTHGIFIPSTSSRIPIPFWLHDFLLHVAACALVAIIVWQVAVLGYKGIIVYSCGTSVNPLAWVCIGGISHLLRILTWRLSLGLRPSTAPSSKPRKWRSINPRWTWNLSGSIAAKLEIRHARIARFLAIVFQIVGIMNYGYGTLIFSGFTLVGPTNAIRVFTMVGFSSLVSRLMAIWLLEVYPDVAVEEGADLTGDQVMKAVP